MHLFQQDFDGISSFYFSTFFFKDPFGFINAIPFTG